MFGLGVGAEVWNRTVMQRREVREAGHVRRRPGANVHQQWCRRHDVVAVDRGSARRARQVCLPSTRYPRALYNKKAHC